MARIGSFEAAEAEASGELDTFMFFGEEFNVAAEVGAMPLMRFAKIASSGIDTGDMAALVAMYDLIRDCLAGPEEWARFEELAMVRKAKAPLLLKVCQDLYAAITARPTTPQSSSSDGLRTTATSPGSSVKPEPSPARQVVPVMGPGGPTMAEPTDGGLVEYVPPALRPVPQPGGIDLSDLFDPDEAPEAATG